MKGAMQEPQVAAAAEALAAAGVQAGADDERQHFMNNVVTVYGIQHAVDNLTKSVHSSLQHWGTFHDQLKQFEALLKKPWRKERFIATCLKNTPLEGSVGVVKAFSQSLYEARWKEVVRFIKHLKPVIIVLRQGFD